MKAVFQFAMALVFSILLVPQLALAAGEVSVTTSTSGDVIDIEINGSGKDDRIEIFVDHFFDDDLLVTELVIAGLDDLYGPGFTTINDMSEVRINMTELSLGDLEIELEGAQDHVEIDLSSSFFDSFPSQLASAAAVPAGFDFSVPITGNLNILTDGISLFPPGPPRKVESTGDDTVIMKLPHFCGQFTAFESSHI
jgi:hypothetical protein